MSTSLLQLRLMARQRADMENSDFIEDPELDRYINDSFGDLYDLLVSKYADYFVDTPTEFTLAEGVSTWDLPDDFYKIVGLDQFFGGGQWLTMRNFNFEQRNVQYNVANQLGIIPTAQYRVVGNLLRFIPTDNAQGTYRIWYTPSYTPLAEEDDELPIQVDRWREYLVIDVAIKMLVKEESDTSQLMQQLMKQKVRIEEMAQNRDEGEPERVTDVRSVGWDNPQFFRTF